VPAPQPGPSCQQVPSVRRPPLRPPEQFAVHDQVTHDKYGLGRVISVEDDTVLIIDFGSRRVRITTPSAKLTKL
jgi:hypothetical protein